MSLHAHPPAAAPAPATLLEVDNAVVTHAFSPSAQPVLTGVNWKVEPGQYWVVGGLPGSGKSDLLAMAAGLSRPLVGECRLFGLPLWEMDETEKIRARLKVGLVFEGASRLLNQLTVAENVALPLTYHSDWEEDLIAQWVGQILEWTGLSKVGGVIPGLVPRNLRPRINLARALAMQPELLLLDNPLKSSDPRETGWWLDFLQRLRAGLPGLKPPQSMVITTDDLRPWMRLGKDFAVLEDGNFIPVGGADQLANNPRPTLQTLLASSFSWP